MYRFFIRRPVTSWMLMFSFILLGLYSYFNIPIDRLPNVDFPTVTISTTYNGADAQTVDAVVTRQIEDELATISGIEYIASSSYYGTSRISVVFSLEKDVDVAAQEVRDAVQRAYGRMPIGVDPPVVRKVDTSGVPVFVMLLHSKTADYQTLAYYADKLIRRDVERIYGVGEVDLGGFRDNVLWVRINPEKLWARGLTPSDVAQVVQNNLLNSPAGSIYGTQRDYVLRLYGKPEKPEDLGLSSLPNGLQLRDVAKVYFGEDEKRGMARFMGEQAIVIVVYKQSNANTVQVVDAVKKKMEEWNKRLPAGMRLDYTFDASIFIKDSVRAAIEEIVMGSFLTAVVVYLFLGSLRVTFVPVFAIPVALLGTIFFLYIKGDSLNTFTLLAMAVAVGIVIDDAIVVLESIFRRAQEGLNPLEAAELGTRIVIFALLASTASLIVVFLPVLFLKGVIGKFFSGFVFTLIVAIAISYLVSLSFTPMATARLVGVSHENKFMRAYAKFEALFDKALLWSLRHKLFVIVISLVTAVLGFFLFQKTKKEFFPVVDEGRFLVRFETPIGSSFDFTEQKTREIEAILRRNPYVDRFGVAMGQGVAGRPDVNGGMGFVYLKSGKRPHMTVIMNQLRNEFSKLRDVRVSVESAPISLGLGRQTDVQYVVKGPYLEELQRIADAYMRDFGNRPGFKDVDTDLRLNEPQVRIIPDRQKLADLGIDVKAVSDTLQILFGKYKVGTYEVGSESYNAYIKADEDFIKEVENLKKVYVRAKNGNLVPLYDVVQIQQGPGYHVINRFNRQYSFTLYANLSGSKDLASALSEVESWLQANLPPGYSYERVGQAREFARSFQGFGFSVLVALLGVYMILASLFESYRLPFIVLLMVPLAAMGAFGLLSLTGTSLSVPSYFGIILLIGIIVRDAVLFIERILQLEKEGVSSREAILQARRERLRPILMTTLTVVAALLPVALGLTAGSEFRKPLAVAIIGGILSGLPLSLFLLPVLYEVFTILKKKTQREHRA
ncbi:efflux RND transporter permease subunit [Thermocrinis minervae]|uniref:Hydrophobic/amphiphilic exporter-1, HAE1 family n=1 Tax=Thermocrinis minervae TaxID=381751 RepID=A0A1M6QQK6_9AQUI|nr:efflux RND transporter permease subunit [Thermocrinis minervae]SHK22380.1 hydrophobic/amphiphilic exporter-1, HAE1 family [Thermocrinis minervae]